MSTAVTKLRYPVAADPLVPLSIVCSVPQSASVALAPLATGWPSATRFATDEPLMSPVAAPGLASACACAAISPAVISPPKIDTVLTSADAVAVASVPDTAETLAFADAVVTMPPSP